jgi:hypothetical protein
MLAGRHIDHHTGGAHGARSQTVFDGLVHGVAHAIVISGDDEFTAHKTDRTVFALKNVLRGACNGKFDQDIKRSSENFVAYLL